MDLVLRNVPKLSDETSDQISEIRNVVSLVDIEIWTKILLNLIDYVLRPRLSCGDRGQRSLTSPGWHKDGLVPFKRVGSVTD